MSEIAEKRTPIKRWLVLGLILLGIYFGFIAGGIFKPTSPAVKLPGEPIWPGVPITNTLLATFIADLILIAIALFSVGGFVRSKKDVPAGFYGFFEFLVEFLWNTTEGAAGKWARRLFPWMATIFLLVFTANMVKLVPGFESIGYLEKAEGSAKGYAPARLFGNVFALDGTKEVPHAEGEAAGEGGVCASCEVVPFLRGSATDLNFTFALAVIAVVMIQVFGVWALGGSYFTKFINTRTMFGGGISGMFGVIDFGVGLLELVSEFAKILSFGFRLFGNIFAGALLLAILGALTVVVVPTGLYLLEVFVGLIQAYVFAMLALVFMSQAVVSHHGGEGH
ncbi:MAG: F0F1 ATP synthase subunit A [Chloroflexi bacterium]|nr:F0F1 ATP synthase subunit A [Chloroflexota bacterium]